MQALCGLQGIFDLFNCKTPDCKRAVAESAIALLFWDFFLTRVFK